MTQIRFCKTSGLLATETCEYTGVGYYTTDNIPGYCNGECLKNKDTDKMKELLSDGNQRKLLSEKMRREKNNEKQ